MTSLTPQQLAHYETFGFVILRGLLDPEEMQALTAELERKLTAVYAHLPCAFAISNQCAFSADACSLLRLLFHHTATHELTRARAPCVDDDSMRHWSGPCLGDDTPLLCGLTEDVRFVGAAQQMYGEDVFLAGVDGNRYTSGYKKDDGERRDAGYTRWCVSRSSPVQLVACE